MGDIEWLRKYEEADTELGRYVARFFVTADEPPDPPLEPVGPDEIAEMARLRQVADEAWTSFMASCTPGEEQTVAAP